VLDVRDARRVYRANLLELQLRPDTFDDHRGARVHLAARQLVRLPSAETELCTQTSLMPLETAGAPETHRNVLQLGRGSGRHRQDS
jgi:hypothetical protein